MVYLLLSKKNFEEFGRCGYTMLEWKPAILHQLVAPLNQWFIHHLDQINLSNFLVGNADQNNNNKKILKKAWLEKKRHLIEYKIALNNYFKLFLTAYKVLFPSVLTLYFLYKGYEIARKKSCFKKAKFNILYTDLGRKCIYFPKPQFYPFSKWFELRQKWMPCMYKYVGTDIVNFYLKWRLWLLNGCFLHLGCILVHI